MPNVSFHTLGCKLNFADTGAIRRDFESRGYDVVPFGESTDVVVVNSCAVTAEAERKCRQVVRRAIRTCPDAFIVVTGCYAQLRPDELADIHGVDAVVGMADKFRFFDTLQSFTRREATQVEVGCIDDPLPHGPTAARERTRAFLKVQDGCDYGCSFCTIPRARGAARSVPLDTVVAEARRLAEEGFPEVVLSGVNVGLYSDGRYDLLDLVRRLDTETNVRRFRISSIEPNLLTDEIVDFVAGSRAFARHFHLPLQSGDDFILGRMRRRYQRRQYANRIEQIVEQMPDACVGADVIAGFPGEERHHFENTIEFISELPIAYLHAFTYSERPGTNIVAQPGIADVRVPKDVRRRRCRRLRALSARKRNAFDRAQVGRISTVVWEAGSGNAHLEGFTDNFVRLTRSFDPALARTVQSVTIGPGGTVLHESARQ